MMTQYTGEGGPQLTRQASLYGHVSAIGDVAFNGQEISNIPGPDIQTDRTSAYPDHSLVGPAPISEVPEELRLLIQQAIADAEI